jgi:hypothetical protein
MTIFTANPHALIAQPGRAVNTFPSGLVRVDQTYLGLASQSAKHRATLAVGNNMPDGNSSPCMDGLKIFPAPQERRREDGFTEYLVSAYGRKNNTGLTSTKWEIFQASHTISSGDESSTIEGIFKRKVVTILQVLNEIEESSYSFSTGSIQLPYPQLINGDASPEWDNVFTLGVASFSSTNYGHFREATIIINHFKKI